MRVEHRSLTSGHHKAPSGKSYLENMALLCNWRASSPSTQLPHASTATPLENWAKVTEGNWNPQRIYACSSQYHSLMLSDRREGRKENPCRLLTGFLRQLHPHWEPLTVIWAGELAHCSLVQLRGPGPRGWRSLHVEILESVGVFFPASTYLRLSPSCSQ